MMSFFHAKYIYLKRNQIFNGLLQKY